MTKECALIDGVIYCQCGDPSSHYSTMGERGAREVRCQAPPSNKQAPSKEQFALNDQSTADPMLKLRRFLLHLAGHDASPYFYADGMPRAALNQDAAEFVKVLDANAKERAEDLDRMERAAEVIEQQVAELQKLRATPEPPAVPSKFDLAFEVMRLMDREELDSLQSCHFGYVLRVEREKHTPPPTDCAGCEEFVRMQHDIASLLGVDADTDSISLHDRIYGALSARAAQPPSVFRVGDCDRPPPTKGI